MHTLIPTQQLLTTAWQFQINNLLNSLPPYPYNIAKATAEMAEPAYPHGFSTTILSYNSGSVVAVAQVIATELGKIGM
jgi:peptide/nickel transport system substrate-binding protein